MTKQVVVIHGGNSFESYEEFLTYLESKEPSIERLKQKDWKEGLSEALGGEYDVLLPRMPNKDNAKYLEWKIWFEKLSQLAEDGVTLVGHSLGGIFLAKYLSEENFPKKISKTILVSAPFDLNLEAFKLPNSLDKFVAQGGEITLFHSKDDRVVPFSELERYKSLLPNAHIEVFEDRGHFNQESFPEIIEIIKNRAN